MKSYLHTPDGRYFVVKDRLWRCQNPHLSKTKSDHLISELGKARNRVKLVEPNSTEMREARNKVDQIKIQLGERGPVWWVDGAPDVNRKHPNNTQYAQWWNSVADSE